MNASLKNWHTFIETKNLKILDDLLANEVTFYSPIVWAPQEGKLIAKLYLMAALEVFGGENLISLTLNKSLIKIIFSWNSLQ